MVADQCKAVVSVGKLTQKKRTDYSPPYDLQGNEGVDTSDNIVHHYTDSAVNLLVEPGDGEGFEDIEDTKERKAEKPSNRV